MIPTTLSRSLAVAAALTVALAGCGDDDDPAAEPTDPGDGTEEPAETEPTEAGAEGGDEAAFVEEADALCAEVNENINGLFAELTGPPEPATFGELAAFGQDFVDGLRALEVPEGDEQVVGEIIATYEEGIAGFEEAAQATDPQAAMAAVEEASATVEEADAAFAEYGVEACQATSGDAPGDDAPAPGPTEVPVILDEYPFGIEPTLAAGPTAFALDNVGEEEHELVLFKLVEGATVDDALAAEQAGQDPEQFFQGPPEVAVAAPGEQVYLNTELTPGDYAMVCFIPTPQGAPHVAEGMVASVEVTG